MPSSTRMPRSVAIPACLAIQALGRMPAAMITSVAGMTRPSASSTPSTLRSPTIALVDALVTTLMPRSSMARLQHVARRRVELALHQRRHEMHDGDIHVARGQARRGFEAEQAAADDHGLGARLGRDQHGVDIVEIAVGEDARKVVPRHRQDERHRARGDDQLVVRRHDAAVGRDRLGDAVDRGDLVPLVERDAVLDVPAVAVNDDLLVVLFTRQHRRQHDAIVVDARLGVENGDLVAAGRLVEKVLQHAPWRHAVADDDEFLGHVPVALRYSAA